MIMFLSLSRISGKRRNKALDISELRSKFPVCTQYLGKNGKAGKTGCVRLRWLRENFEKLPKDVPEGSEQFMWHVRAYVLYIIGSMILPNKSGAYVSISLLPLLKQKDDFNKYSWGAALLAHLRKCIKACLDKNGTCVAGHTYSLMLFGIEHFPLLALHVMGNKKPSPGDKEDFLNRRPKVFLLIQGWAEVLHRAFNNKENQKEYLRILRKHTAEDPYKRLSPLSRFLPGYLVGQQRMGLSCTVLLCFEIVVHHRPDLCPKQFGLDLVKQLPSLPRKRKEFRRAGHTKDWLSDKKMQPFIATWAKREELLICDVPNDALDDGNMLHYIANNISPRGLANFSTSSNLAVAKGATPPLLTELSSSICSSEIGDHFFISIYLANEVASDIKRTLVSSLCCERYGPLNSRNLNVGIGSGVHVPEGGTGELLCDQELRAHDLPGGNE
ncbi:hypothetical protein LguiB_012366 [Lonicera macranthoides]